MFIIQRSAFCYSVDVQESGVLISPVGLTLELTTAFSPSIIRTLTIVCNYYISNLNLADREAYLQAYFQSKGYTVSLPDYHLKTNELGEMTVSV